MLIIQLSKVTEVLSKKYENLGVIQVINNFHSNYKFIIQSIYENQELLLNTINDSTNNNEIDYKLIQSSEILLQFLNLMNILLKMKMKMFPLMMKQIANLKVMMVVAVMGIINYLLPNHLMPFHQIHH